MPPIVERGHPSEHPLHALPLSRPRARLRAGGRHLSSPHRPFGCRALEIEGDRVETVLFVGRHFVVLRCSQGHNHLLAHVHHPPIVIGEHEDRGGVWQYVHIHALRGGGVEIVVHGLIARQMTSDLLRAGNPVGLLLHGITSLDCLHPSVVRKVDDCESDVVGALRVRCHQRVVDLEAQVGYIAGLRKEEGLWQFAGVADPTRTKEVCGVCADIGGSNQVRQVHMAEREFWGQGLHVQLNSDQKVHLNGGSGSRGVEHQRIELPVPGSLSAANFAEHQGYLPSHSVHL
mmetsp:Transcript_16978/g.26298  ORF Transcript_16978/g.26298 Transcript_16978/m.26298 type:complete len:288 (-) Transcript_16978:182-1045(-)